MSKHASVRSGRNQTPRKRVRFSQFTDADHLQLATHRHASLDERSEEEIAAGVRLGLQAMHTLPHTAQQLRFLRGLVQMMGAPEKCLISACTAYDLCLHEKVQCYWRNREHVRATFPQIDDGLMRLALSDEDAIL